VGIETRKWKWIGRIPRKGKGLIKRVALVSNLKGEDSKKKKKKNDQEERGEEQLRMKL
jgi:hypothetical protein